MDPATGLITGLARAARSDNNALHLVTYDLDMKQKLPEAAAVHISAILESSFGIEQEGEGVRDMEFVERLGQIYVPRIVEAHHLQLHLSSEEIEPQVEVQDFLPVRKIAALAGGNAGSSGQPPFCGRHISYRPARTERAENAAKGVWCQFPRRDDRTRTARRYIFDV